MAKAARYDDHRNAVKVEDEGVEGEEGIYHDTEGHGKGDEAPCDAHTPHVRGMHAGENPDLRPGGYRPHHGLDPLPPDPMDLLGNLVDALHDASLQVNPAHRCRFQQAARRHMQGGALPNLYPDSDSEDDDTACVKIPPPIFKGIPGERPNAHIYAAKDWMEVMHF